MLRPFSHASQRCTPGLGFAAVSPASASNRSTRGRTMRIVLTAFLMSLGFVTVHSDNALSAPTCVEFEPGKLRCAIVKASDCHQINDFPYARALFCGAAFSAAQTMVSEVAQALKVGAPVEGFFHYYQTLEDPVAQTTATCMDTPAPYPGGSKFVKGAGIPLCNLVAFVTSPSPDVRRDRKGNDPIPKDLRTYPEFFSKLYEGDKLSTFRPGHTYDRLVIGLGAGAEEQFRKDYHKFSATTFYAPDHWAKESQYRGISGGGGGGWGGELAILGPQGPVVQLALGGGGGGGMTSFQPDAATPATSSLGAGGGAGIQFADGYRFGGKSFNGLGLGAGTGSGESVVEYSYNDYEGSLRPPQPVHQFNAPIIADYVSQLRNLVDQLRAAYASDKTIVLRGGGGMGAGTEYLMTNGQQFLPSAMSTQGGFQFSYEFRRRPLHADPGAAALDNLNAEQENIYAIIGDAWLTARDPAFEECGRDYANFTCMCQHQHAHVICYVIDKVGDATKIPSWLNQRHCPGDDELSGQNGLGSTSYQQFLLDASSASCTIPLMNFFKAVNTP